ncbi:hypothetical protein [Alteromonas sp. H39]|uniref:hypothetical protein n=1 Tax=Alteromonas sp. H39 TaxID=3389876 RepID=UPI0039DF9DDC
MTTILTRTIKLGVFSLLLTGAASADTLTVETTSTGPAAAACPVEFHSIVIPDSAKQCQLFDTAMDDDVIPASMVHFMADSKDQVISFYQQAIPGLTVHSTFNERTLLVANDNAIRVVVSPDGSGTQVDILVTAKG